MHEFSSLSDGSALLAGSAALKVAVGVALAILTRVALTRLAGRLDAYVGRTDAAPIEISKKRAPPTALFGYGLTRGIGFSAGK